MADSPRATYSYSRITAFSQCSRSYKFRYIDRIREAFTSVEAHLGRAVHGALAWLYESRESSEAPSCPELLEKFDAEWGSGLGPRVRVIRREDSLEARRDIGRTMLEEHHAGPFRNDRLTTIAIEKSLKTRLEGDYSFRGIIDRLAKDTDGDLHLIDYKTTGRPPAILDQKQTLQLRSYGMLALEHHGGDRAKLTYQFLKNGREWTGTCGPNDSLALSSELAVRISEIEAAGEYPPTNSALCAWCGYRDICDVSGFYGGDGASGSMQCPSCDGRLRERNGKFGSFLGCENYPRCRFSRNL